MKRNSKSGFTLVEIMIVVAIIGLLAAIAVPSYLNARYKSQQSACLDNLRILEGGMEQYKMDNNNTAPTAVSDLIPKYVKAEPICKAGGTYDVTGESPTCSATEYGDYPHTIETAAP